MATSQAGPIQGKVVAGPPMDANQKAGLLMALSQLDMLIAAFANAPEKVLTAAKEFKAALEQWANG